MKQKRGQQPLSSSLNTTLDVYATAIQNGTIIHATETKMKKLLGLLLLLSLTSCATVDYQPYEGKAGAVWEGQGGTKLVVDGIEFWDNGAPPHKYKVVGYATGAVGADSLIRGVVAGKVKALGGGAAILVTGNTSELGFVKTAPNMWMTASKRELKYAVVQYLN